MLVGGFGLEGFDGAFVLLLDYALQVIIKVLVIGCYFHLVINHNLSNSLSNTISYSPLTLQFLLPSQPQHHTPKVVHLSHINSSIQQLKPHLKILNIPDTTVYILQLPLTHIPQRRQHPPIMLFILRLAYGVIFQWIRTLPPRVNDNELEVL